MKKSKLLVLIIISLLLVVGCKSNTSADEVHQHCTREGKIEGDGKVELNYDIYYKGDNLNLLISEEKVISDDEEQLTTYENAYKEIHKNYEGLKYYDTEVIREDTSVTSKIKINYAKIDIGALLDIEDAKDNIIKNGKAKVKKWKELAKKFGTTCKTVED